MERRRFGSYGNNTSFTDPEEEADETPVRKKRSAETSVDCREKDDTSPTITGIVAHPAEAVKLPCRLW